MHKRILSLVIVFSLLMSLFTFSYAETEETELVEGKYEVLKLLGIVNERIGGETSVFGELSKLNFINNVCNILGDYNFTAEYNAEAVKVAEDAGIIHKNQDDLYKPICYEEAATMLVRLFGYEEEAQEGGGYPTGYLQIAQRLGLNDGLSVSPTEAMKEHDIITLLYNAINAGCPVMEYITEDGIVYSLTAESTFLYETRRIYKVQGVLESTESSILRADYPIMDGKVMIDGYVYNAEDDFSDMLGLGVEAFVQEKRSDDDTVLFVTPYNNKELVVASEDIKEMSADFKTFTYIGANDKEKEITVSPVAAVLYNGQPIRKYTPQTFKPADGSVRFIDNDGKSGYDTVIITSYKTIVVDYVNESAEVVKNLYTKDSTTEELNLDAGAKDFIKIINGDNEISIEDIKSGDVLRVAESELDERRRVVAELSSKQISGVVSKVANKDEVILTIDGKEYALSAAYEDMLDKKDPKALAIELGKSYIFGLDSAGKIAYAKEADGFLRYGIVMATKIDTGWLAKCEIRLFTTTGEVKEYTFDEKIAFVDNEGEYAGVEQRVLAEDKVGKIPTARGGEISVIKYSTNSDGKINHIELPQAYDKGNNGKFNVTSRTTKIPYRPNNTSFNSDVYLADGVEVIFVNTAKMADEDGYTLKGTTGLIGDTEYVFNAYDVDDYNFAELIVVMEDEVLAQTGAASANLFVVDGVGQMLNAEGEVTGVITGMMGGYETLTYYCDDEDIIKAASKGDIISVYADSMGNIVSVYAEGADSSSKYNPWNKVEYDNDGNLKPRFRDQSQMHGISKVVSGTVVRNDYANSRIRMTVAESGTERVLRTPADSIVIIYDMEADTISRGTLKDIEDDAIITVQVVRSKPSTFIVYQ